MNRVGRISVLLIPLCLTVWTSCTGHYETRDPGKTAEAYCWEFGSPPPPAVSDLQLRQVVIGDTMMEWLCFRSDRVTFDAILTAKSFVPIGEAEFTGETVSPNSPSWWTPAKGMPCYRKEDWNRAQIDGGDSSRAWIGYDEKAGMVYFSRSQWN